MLLYQTTKVHSCTIYIVHFSVIANMLKFDQNRDLRPSDGLSERPYSNRTSGRRDASSRLTIPRGAAAGELHCHGRRRNVPNRAGQRRTARSATNLGVWSVWLLLRRALPTLALRPHGCSARGGEESERRGVEGFGRRASPRAADLHPPRFTSQLRCCAATHSALVLRSCETSGQKRCARTSRSGPQRWRWCLRTSPCIGACFAWRPLHSSRRRSSLPLRTTSSRPAGAREWQLASLAS